MLRFKILRWTAFKTASKSLLAAIICMVTVLHSCLCLADVNTPHKPKPSTHAKKGSKHPAPKKINKSQSHVKHASSIKKHKKIKQTHKQRKKFSAHVEHAPDVPAITADVVQVKPSSRTLVASMEQRLVEFVHKTVDTIRYSSYKLGGRMFDTARGVYVVDCSNYVDHILQKIYPHAYSNLVNRSGSGQPTSLQYYDFFTGLSDGPHHYWNKVDEVKQLQPGDILVFRNKSMYGHHAGGHVMIVMKKPVPDANDFMIRVADSAPVGHSQDTRSKHVSGIGIGTLLLKVDPETGEPSAYAWKVGSHWKRNVNFAMGRPVDTHKAAS